MKKNYSLYLALLLLAGAQAGVQAEDVAMLGNGLMQVIAAGEASENTVSLKELVENFGGSVQQETLDPTEQQYYEELKKIRQQKKEEAAEEQAELFARQKERKENKEQSDKEAKNILDQKLGGSDEETDSSYMPTKQLTAEERQQQRDEADKKIDNFVAQKVGTDKSVNQEFIEALKIKAKGLSQKEKEKFDKTIDQLVQNAKDLKLLEQLFAPDQDETVMSDEKIAELRKKQQKLKKDQEKNKQALEDIGFKVKDQGLFSSWFQ